MKKEGHISKPELLEIKFIPQETPEKRQKAKKPQTKEGLSSFLQLSVSGEVHVAQLCLRGSVQQW